MGSCVHTAKPSSSPTSPQPHNDEESSTTPSTEQTKLTQHDKPNERKQTKPSNINHIFHPLTLGAPKASKSPSLSRFSTKARHSRVDTLSDVNGYDLIEEIRDVIDDHDHEDIDDRTIKKVLLNDEEDIDEELECRIDLTIQEIHKQDSLSIASMTSFKSLSIDCKTADDDELMEQIKRLKKQHSFDTISNKLAVKMEDEYNKQRIDRLIDWIQIEEKENEDELLMPKQYRIKQEELIKSKEYDIIRDEIRNEMDILFKGKNKMDLKCESSNIECRGKLKKDIFIKCECMKRIKLILNGYQKYMKCDKLWRKVPFGPILSFDGMYDIQQLMDDFIHIKYVHIDKDNDILNKEKMEKENKGNNSYYAYYQNIAQFVCNELEKECKCKIEECFAYKRQNRERTNDEKEKELYFKSITRYDPTSKNEFCFNKDIVFLQECDKIHSYFLHSTVKFGRNADQIDVLNEEKLDLNEKLKGRKNKKMSIYVGKKEDEKWWNDVKIDKKQSNKQIYRNLVQNMGIFRWQSAHGFRAGQNQGISQLKPLYLNIKEEALYNEYHPISKDNWNQTLRKSKIFNQSWARQQIRTQCDGYFDDKITQQKSSWYKGVEITMQEIVILKLYTDFDKLQFALKKCFRFESITDIVATSGDFSNQFMSNKQDLEKRLKTFFHWKGGLEIVLNKFGKKLNGNNYMSLYHGVNAKMILSSSSTFAFYGPLSTTSSYHVARTFATAKGMVLKITTMFPRLNYCNAFDASLISDYPEEQEWLIGFMYVRVLEIRTKKLTNNIPLASWMREEFFAIHLFKEQMFSMSQHLERIQAKYLKCNQYECCKNKDKYKMYDDDKYDDDDDDEKLKYLCCNIAKHKDVSFEFDPFKTKIYKNDNDIKRVKKIYPIIWEKFNFFRNEPNLKQCIKIDNISQILKRFFMEKNNDKNNEWIISFKRIINIYPNCKEIHFLNQYKFNDKVLEKLIKQIKKKGNKLEKIKFLYYNYNKILNEKIFINPNKLNKKLLNELKNLNWKIKHNKNGNTGYKIRVFLNHQ